jgi:DNA polymerase-3 subunit alpha
LRRTQSIAVEKQSGQVGLFAQDQEVAALRLPDMGDWPPMERLGFEAEAIGFHLTAHPLDAYAQVLRRMRVIPSNELAQLAAKGDTRVRLAGSVVATKERITRTGTRMSWVRLSDAGGSFEVTVFSDVLSRVRDLLGSGATLLVSADLRTEGETLRITAQDVSLLDKAVADAGQGMRVWLRETEAVDHIRTVLTREGDGRGTVVLVPQIDVSQDVEITLPGRFNVTPRLAQALRLIPGVERVEEL